MVIQDGIKQTAGDIHAFLMIGQSNMEGRGDFGEVEPIKNDKCYMLRMGRWQAMSEPVNPDRAIFGTNFHSGVCLAASFADEFAKRSGEKVGLIPCADGGTRISQWMPGEVLYDHAVMMAKLAMRTSHLCGILWHQGESDCHSDGELAEHKQKLLTVMRSLRRDLGGEPMPIVIGELSEKITEKWNVADRPAKMNRAFYEIAEQLSPCAVVSAEGLSLKADGIHFDSASLREFGKRYFEAYKTIGEPI